MTDPQTLQQLRQSAYMKLLGFAASKAGSTFTAAEAMTTTSVSQSVFNDYVDDLYVEDKNQPGSYRIALPAVFQYIQFAELQHAVASAADAKKESASAFKVAVIAIIVSGVLAGLQLYFQVSNTTTKLDNEQLTKIEAVSKPVVIAIEKLTASQADATNKLLQQNIDSAQEMCKANTELIELLSKKPPKGMH